MADDHPPEVPERGGEATTGYQTLQFHVGGLFDGRTIEAIIHLVRQKGNQRTPGPTLCGIDRSAKDAPGWSVGGGFSGEWTRCPACDSERDRELPVRGMHGALFAATLKVTP